MRTTERRLARLEQAAAPATSEPMDTYTDAERRHSLACLLDVLGLDATDPDARAAELLQRLDGIRTFQHT